MAIWLDQGVRSHGCVIYCMPQLQQTCDVSQFGMILRARLVYDAALHPGERRRDGYRTGSQPRRGRY